MSIVPKTYSTLVGEDRCHTRDFVRYAYDSGNITQSKTAATKRSGFNLAAKFDGQSLAGTGALVFEGELLEFPR